MVKPFALKSDQAWNFSVQGTEACTLEINYNSFQGKPPFHAAVYKVGCLRGDAEPLASWFSDGLTDEAKQGLYDSVGLTMQNPQILIATDQCDAQEGTVTLDIP